jgi:asparagine synthase (glutamine-hydrolysing)
MCGIAGFVGAGDLEVLRRMTDALRHRGPDGEGLWMDEETRVFLGFRRLSIIDLEGGAQPMWTSLCAKCGTQPLGVVFNGEIYNHAELRAELKQRGHIFTTDHSDTEVLLHGYGEWGDAFVERLNGMWAFVIYDRARRRLFGSRDRFAKKPLYYFHEGGTFGFASELPSLLQHPAAPRGISTLSLKKYFAYCYIPAPRSIYERVWKLSGGHSFSYDLTKEAFTTWCYWKFAIETDSSFGSPANCATDLPNKSPPIPKPWPRSVLESLCEELRDLLERAVKCRLMSDVPLGVFLSGGIDSTAIAAFAARHLPARELNTFSIGFNEPSFDESAYARRAAERVGTRHHEEILDLDKSTALLPEIISRLDEPLGDGSLLPTYLLARFTRQHVTVALGGDGGDELFAGYDPFRALQAAEKYARMVPRRLHVAIRLLASRLPVSHRNISFDFKIKRTLMGLSYPAKLWNPVWMGAAEPSEITELFREPTDVEEIYSEAIESWDANPHADIVDRALQFWTNLYLRDGILAKVDRASMMCSLEARAPFLDIDLVNLARRIPHQLKLRGGQTKWILKRALEPILPCDIVQRPKKGFGMPVGRWLREERFQFKSPETSTGLNYSFVERKLAAHRANKSDERLFLWSYWLLTQWMKG